MTSLENTSASEFLALVYPQGPWALTAIAVEKKQTETRTFYPEDKTALVAWLLFHDKRSNLYWHVNPVIRPVFKKAERTDIKAVCYLHVDVDLEAAEDIAGQRKRILGMLQRPAGTVPPPTCIISSGGGYQAFWRLRDPISIDGNLDLAEDAKRYNQQLEIVFGADNCHNIDRLCRLPGTWNMPDVKKQKKGRTPAIATLVEWNADSSYEQSAFLPAPLPQGDFSQKRTPGVTGNVKRLASVDELSEWGVPDRIKVIVVQGRFPDEKKLSDDSRSAWLFDALCGMVRCSVPDEVIYSVITDPDFRISDSVLELGGSAEKYALRQIERAHEEAIEPWLRKLNEKHAVIGNLGGKCRVIEEVLDPGLHRAKLTKQSFEDFRNRYLNQYVKSGVDKAGNDKMSPVGHWWLAHPQRRQFSCIVFSPRVEVPDAYNLWRGFACAAKPGNCALYWAHLMYNICGNNLEHYEYLVSWMARAVQFPDSQGETAVVLQGNQGTGKGWMARPFGGLFGRHFMQVSNAQHMVGNFNSHLRDTVVLFADEAFFAGDKRHEGVLKTLITEETLAVEGKGVDVETAPNYTHVIMASNNNWVIPAGAHERRFFVLKVGDAARQDTDYFAALEAQMANGGREALLYELLNRDISKFNVRDVPKTDALREQKLLSLGPEEEWWYRKLCDGQLLEGDDGWAEEMRKKPLLDDYADYMRRINAKHRSNETVLGRYLLRVCPGLTTFQANASVEVPLNTEGWTKKVRQRCYFWGFPSLDVCRARWQELYAGGKFENHAVVEKQEEM